MDKKYGVYICEGCGIGEALDVQAIKDVADEEGLTAKTHPIMCSPEGVDFLKEEIEGGVNTLVLCACSRRVNYDVFRFEGCIVDRVNLREGVAWSHPRSEFPALTEEEKEDEANFDRVQMMAEDYLRILRFFRFHAWYGDPAFDVAFFLNHLFLKSLYHAPRVLPFPRLIQSALTGFCPAEIIFRKCGTRG